MSEKKIVVERRGHVLLMGLNRPDKMNAFDVEMYRELAVALGELHRDGELRCGLLYAHGNHFTAGLDLPQWAPSFSEARFPDLPSGACDPFGLDEEKRVGKPLVMAAQDICYTIGLELMLAMDIRVAASDVRFGQIEVRRGFTPWGAPRCACIGRSAGAMPCATCSRLTRSAQGTLCASASCRR